MAAHVSPSQLTTVTTQCIGLIATPHWRRKQTPNTAFYLQRIRRSNPDQLIGSSQKPERFFSRRPEKFPLFFHRCRIWSMCKSTIASMSPSEEVDSLSAGLLSSLRIP
ncbi:hypothetical protein AcV5_006314 [Taiwanofungus camphoratus]|nr:hypothetical protein AcV5_006314 [Antrodia cinnamomea]KAI0950223.1 hypothetical protein AcV7_008760 [Antrodia cinnamomea]